MKCIVIGGCGFIGSHLCDYLLSKGNEVLCVDNLVTGDVSNIEDIYNHRGFDFIRQDVAHFNIAKALAEKIRLKDVNEIYYLASIASPDKYLKMPIETIEANIFGLRNLLEIAVSNKIKFLYTSTSEIYGDPLEHPQKESYHGNVDPCSDRSVYDESKRMGETLVMTYRKQYGLNTRIVRIFNSLTGDQNIIYYLNGILHYEPFEVAYNKIIGNENNVKVPCFNNKNEVIISPISDIIKHKVNKIGFKIKTTWGKEIKITEDHSLFTRDKNGNPEPIFGRNLRIGDYIAIPNLIPIEKLQLPKFEYNKKEINVNNDFMWLLGLIVAEACISKYSYKRIMVRKNKKYTCKRNDHILCISSNTKYLNKAKKIIKEIFNYNCCYIKPSKNRAPALRISNKELVNFFANIAGLGYVKSHEKFIPIWIIQSEDNQVLSFLQGYWNGDGNHDAITTNKKIIFTTVSKKLKDDLSLLLLRFGIIPSISYYKTWIKDKNGNKKFYDAITINIQGLSNYNILNLNNSKQVLQRLKSNNIQWAHIVDIEKFIIDDFVYDFSVPEYENFIGGDFIFAHNTYGPRMNIGDGRVIPNFINQALNNKDITVYGDGNQTRSFCYIDDMVKAILLVMNCSYYMPMNIGNPYCYYSVIELANMIKNLTDSNSNIINIPFKSQNDPKVRRPDISLIKSKAGWAPLTDLKIGLESTIDYYRAK